MMILLEFLWDHQRIRSVPKMEGETTFTLCLNPFWGWVNSLKLFFHTAYIGEASSILGIKMFGDGTCKNGITHSLSGKQM